jgi:hypothetical protein
MINQGDEIIELETTDTEERLLGEYSFSDVNDSPFIDISEHDFISRDSFENLYQILNSDELNTLTKLCNISSTQDSRHKQIDSYLMSNFNEKEIRNILCKCILKNYTKPQFIVSKQKGMSILESSKMLNKQIQSFSHSYDAKVTQKMFPNAQVSYGRPQMINILPNFKYPYAPNLRVPFPQPHNMMPFTVFQNPINKIKNMKNFYQKLNDVSPVGNKNNFLLNNKRQRGPQEDHTAEQLKPEDVKKPINAGDQNNMQYILPLLKRVYLQENIVKLKPFITVEAYSMLFKCFVQRPPELLDQKEIRINIGTSLLLIYIPLTSEFKVIKI